MNGYNISTADHASIKTIDEEDYLTLIYDCIRFLLNRSLYRSTGIGKTAYLFIMRDGRDDRDEESKAIGGQDRGTTLVDTPSPKSGGASIRAVKMAETGSEP
jgi:hypothetical protein